MKTKLLLIFVSILMASCIVHATELTISIPVKQQTLMPGDEIDFEVTIKEKEISGRHDVDFVYEIRDEKDFLLVASKETKAIETQASFVSSLNVPINAVDGQHTIVVRVNQTEASASFYVLAAEEDSVMTYILVVVVVILMIFLLILWELNIIRQKLKPKR